MATQNVYMLILGHPAALAWVLSEGRMAFPADRARTASWLSPGDAAFIYATGKCYRRAHGRGRVIGEVTLSTAVTPLEQPVRFGGRRFTVGCNLIVEALAPVLEGPVLAPLVPQMHAFPVSAHWSVYTRRPMIALDDHDATLLRTALSEVTGPPVQAIPGYLDLADALSVNT